MTGFPPLLSFEIFALVVIPLGIALKRWYGRDAGRSLVVLIVLLAFVSPWLAFAMFVFARLQGIQFQRGPHIQGN
jgi:hypothetical protein